MSYIFVFFTKEQRDEIDKLETVLKNLLADKKNEELKQSEDSEKIKVKLQQLIIQYHRILSPYADLYLRVNYNTYVDYKLIKSEEKSPNQKIADLDSQINMINTKLNKYKAKIELEQYVKSYKDIIEEFHTLHKWDTLTNERQFKIMFDMCNGFYQNILN